MDMPPIRYATAADGARISYVQFPGASPPFLVMYNPGSPQLALKMRLAGYTHFATRFRRGRCWVLFDWRGTGLSSPIRRSLSIDDLALDIEAVAAALCEPVDAIAVENACHPVLALAARAPGCFRSIWIQAPWSARNQRANRPGWEADYPGHLLDIMVHAGASYPLAAEIATAWEQGVPAGVFGAYLEAVRTADSWDLLPQVALPVWVTATPGDEPAAARVAAFLADATISIAAPDSPTMDLRDWTRDDWDRNLGARLGDLPVPPALDVHGSNGATLSQREMEVLSLLVAGKSNKEIAEVLVLGLPTVATHVRHILEKTGSANRVEATNWAREHANLTTRELDVLCHLATGCTNDEIATGLCLSTRTVERHVQNIYTKLNVHNRTQAANWARDHGVT